jgi:hypothetical protein
MAKYFNYFPKAIYSPQNAGEGYSVDYVTNITSRFGFEASFKENTSVYYKYDIQDSDTPEIIADKMYGSSEKHWVILMLNDIVDPQFDWPLDQRTINVFINEKYSANASVGQTGISWAQQNTHSYYRVEKRTTISTGTYDEKEIQLDANTYTNTIESTNTVTLKDGNTIKIDVTKKTKSYYEYEIETNEAKRTINILKPEFVPAVESELKKVFNYNRI